MQPLLRIRLSRRVAVLFALSGMAVFVLAATEDRNADHKSGTISWSKAPTEQTGFYYMYDDSEQNPPFEDPVLPVMPADYSEYSIHDTTAAEKLAPYNDEPFPYALLDSFWYYGYWLKPNDYIYVSPDGWVSFDYAAEDGFPDPPSTSPPFPNIANPNMVIAPLWADYDPTRILGNVSNNRVYYMYNLNTNALIVEWYQIQGQATGNEYTFLVELQLGGQALLEEYSDCGVVFSYHLIHFMYNTASAGWTADNGAIGLEDPDGTKGITYTGTVNTSSDNMHTIRIGYKRTIKYDVMAYAILSPGTMVLRWTKIEPKVVVANVGEETEHFAVNLEIIDSAGTGQVVYNQNLGSYNLLPGFRDTLLAPCWTPGEFGEEYRLKLSVELDRDLCTGNDLLSSYTSVKCEDTARYDSPNPQYYIPGSFTNAYQLAAFYASDYGLLITGGEVRTPKMNSPFTGAVWEAIEGCGLPQDPPLATAVPALDTPWSSFTFSGGGVFAHSSSPGNIWVGAIPTSSNYAAYFGMWPNIVPESPCYLGDVPSPTVYRTYGTWDWPAAVSGLCVAAYVHLGFGSPPLSPKSAPPCYYDEPHDISCYEIKEPHIEYVEAGQAITPEIGIVNLGLTAEPDAEGGFFPVTLYVIDPDSLDTLYVDSTMVNHIGWLGDDADDPDTVIVSGLPWTPEGYCHWLHPVAFYELIGIVRLGEVGPDESDHCPYNDTIRQIFQCLFSHDVGLGGITLKPHSNDNYYNPGTNVTVIASVENYGFNEEYNISVRCEIIDITSDSDTMVYDALQEVEFLDWKGNVLDRPYVTSVEFPVWTVPSTNHFVVECRTEMVGDQCPENDFRVAHVNGAISETPAGLPFALESVSPNPFVGSTTISYILPSSVNVSLKVYDVSGKLISTLVEGSRLPGRHTVTWNGTDDAGHKVATGIYLVRMDAEKYNATKKVVLY